MKIHNEQTRIIYDTPIINYLKELAPKRVCVTSDPLMIKLNVLKPVEDYFSANGIPYQIFSDVRPDPDMSLVKEGLAHIFDVKPDLIIAVGGGSAIDLAKAIMFFCMQVKGELIEEENLKKPFFVAVPTTAGTGSEVTNYTVISDESTGSKHVIQSELMQPDAAVLDVSLTMTAPPSITADTGFDALTHAIEAYTCSLHTPFSDAYALKAVDLIFNSLVPAYEDKTLRPPKEQMQIAATLAGLAFNHSGLGISHSISHSLGSRFHIPHGRANALVLPQVMRFNLRDRATEKRYEQLSRTLGMMPGKGDRNARAMVLAVEALKKLLHLPEKISDLDIDPGRVDADMPGIAQDALKDYCTPSHPFNVTYEDICGIVKQLL